MAVLPRSNSWLSVPGLLLLGVTLLFRASPVAGACQYTDQVGYELSAGIVSPYDSNFGQSDLAACKALCDAAATCVALGWHSGVCDLYNRQPNVQTSTDPASVMSTKTCTTACTNTVLSDTTGAENYAARLDAASSYACRTLCRVVDTCRVASHVTSTSTCSLFLASDTSSASGVVTFQKNRCEDGSDCCFVESAGIHGTGTAALTVSATAASCQSLCESVSGCVAATFKAGQCYLYSESTATSALTGSTHVVRTCSTGSSSVGAMITCNSAFSATYGAAKFRLYGILVLCLLRKLLGA